MTGDFYGRGDIMYLHIAVCDDEEQIGFRLEEYFEEICAGLNISVETDVYYSGEGLCRRIGEGECYDLIFLDIEMTGLSGIQTGTKIRDEYNDETTQIVYISGKQQYALELFDTNPLNFLVKPFGYEEVRKVINRFLKISGFWSGIFTFRVGHDTYRVKLGDIMYFQSRGRKIGIFFKDGEDEIYGNMEELYGRQLEKYGCFLFIHRSYIVNYDYVRIFEYEKIVLCNGKEFPVAQPRRAGIRALQKELDRRGK